MAEVIARVRKEMQERLEQLEAELANAEALFAERAQIQRVLATPPFATPDPPRQARRAAPAAPVERDETVPAAHVEAAPPAEPSEIGLAARIESAPSAVGDDSPPAAPDEICPVAQVEAAPLVADDVALVALDEVVGEDLAA